MGDPDSLDPAPRGLSRELLLNLQSRTREVLDNATALLESGTVQDVTDRRFVAEAVAFIENPTEDIEEIKSHTTNIGQVLGGYGMQGTDPSPEIDAVHAYLLALQCINRINFVETELEQGSPDSSAIQHAMAQALDWATILASGYKDNTLLAAVNELQARLN